MQNPESLQRSWPDRLATILVLLLLVLTLIIGTGSMIHGQLLRMGERMFGNPDAGIQYSFLRADPEKPTCDPNPNIDAQVQQEMSKPADDLFGDLFGDAKDPEQIRQSLVAAQKLCQEKFTSYDAINTHITPTVRAYRTFETAFFGIFRFGMDNRSLILVLLIAIAAIRTTAGIHHIGIRPPATKIDFMVYNGSMVLGNALLLFSSVSYFFSRRTTGLELETLSIVINVLWIVLFAVLMLISVWKMIKPPTPVKEGGSFGLALLAMPLFAVMAIVTGIPFIFFQGYPTGQAIYMGQLIEYANLFLNLALFIWIGMLLKQTRVVDLFINILRPWNFSPELLTWILMLGAAVLTAYTGASGIFVIAAGAIIYKEVLNSGARRQYALAATAMSGSLGVVLRPCLLIVVIAAMNREVTTDLLYGHGIYIFLVSSTLLLIFSLFLADQKVRIAAPSQALRPSVREFGPVAPYIVVTIAVIAAYYFLLDTKLDEFTAPLILPFIMLAVVAYDKLRRDPAQPVPVVGATASASDVESVSLAKAADSTAPQSDYLRTNDPKGKERRIGFNQAVFNATHEAMGHIGALIMLMALTVSVGGLIERSHVMEAIPTDMASPLMAISILLVLLVFVGMVMDPFGAVILVTATVAPVAYANGIDPVHFWMIVLAAFELGYLSPPVALNQLLARQVVGEKEMDEADAEVRHKSFYYRYERWILPFVVMLLTLLIVAYAPYFLGLFGWY
ncbi:MAG: TRAP transporter large permease subunit [Pseudomonadota bacterium]|nr:TRAP transporter large permease subunit [Pseudomonadota bacterium]